MIWTVGLSVYYANMRASSSRSLSLPRLTSAPSAAAAASARWISLSLSGQATFDGGKLQRGPRREADDLYTGQSAHRKVIEP